jgi:hypothetical protein
MRSQSTLRVATTACVVESSNREFPLSPGQPAFLGHAVPKGTTMFVKSIGSSRTWIVCGRWAAVGNVVAAAAVAAATVYIGVAVAVAGVGT